jgi:hypothetical protein
VTHPTAGLSLFVPVPTNYLSTMRIYLVRELSSTVDEPNQDFPMLKISKLFLHIENRRLGGIAIAY